MSEPNPDDWELKLNELLMTGHLFPSPPPQHFIDWAGLLKVQSQKPQQPPNPVDVSELYNERLALLQDMRRKKANTFSRKVRTLTQTGVVNALKKMRKNNPVELFSMVNLVGSKIEAIYPGSTKDLLTTFTGLTGLFRRVETDITEARGRMESDPLLPLNCLGDDCLERTCRQLCECCAVAYLIGGALGKIACEFTLLIKQQVKLAELAKACNDATTKLGLCGLGQPGFSLSHPIPSHIVGVWALARPDGKHNSLHRINFPCLCDAVKACLKLAEYICTLCKSIPTAEETFFNPTTGICREEFKTFAECINTLTKMKETLEIAFWFYDEGHHATQLVQDKINASMVEQD